MFNGARHFQISQTKISRLSARCTLKSLYLDWKVLFWNSKSTLSNNFFKSVLLFTRSYAQFSHLGADFQIFIYFSHLPRGFICSLPRSVFFRSWTSFLGAAALYVPSLRQKHALWWWKNLNGAIEYTNLKTQNTGAGRFFLGPRPSVILHSKTHIPYPGLKNTFSLHLHLQLSWWRHDDATPTSFKLKLKTDLKIVLRRANRI